MELEVQSEHELPAVAEKMLDFAGDTRLWLFYGDLGAGKTTLIKSIGALLNVVDTMSSPSFSIVNEYQRKNGDPVYHLDFYRIKKEEEAIDLGYDEYFFSEYYCLVEWPEKIPSLIPEEYLAVEISNQGAQKRLINLNKVYDKQR